MERRELEALVEMGFAPRRAQQALALTGHRGIEPAMDWLVAHEDDPDTEDPDDIPPTLGGDPKGDTGGDSRGGRRQPVEDEREEEAQRLVAAAGRERARRRQGQELARLRQRLREEEERRAAAQRSRERAEERLARQRVREKIERDKAERAQKFGTGPVPTEPPPAAPTGPEAPGKREYEQCRIQLRLPDGQVLTQSFRAKEPLAAVRLYVELHRGTGGTSIPSVPSIPGVPEAFSLRTAFPRRLFTEEDMEKPLQELGLVPSAVIIVAKKEGS